MTYPIFENLETGERLYFVKNLNPEYPTNKLFNLNKENFEKIGETDY